jgi:hypothetical protein
MKKLLPILLLWAMSLSASIPKRMTRVTLDDSPTEQAKAYQVHDGLHVRFIYQVGLLAGIDLARYGDKQVTTLTVLDPLKPLLRDSVEIHLCGDVTGRFAGLYHGWLTLVYSRTSPSLSTGCHETVAIYQITPPETAPELP